MEQLLDSAIKKSRKMSAFKGHIMANSDEKQKELYIKLLFGAAEYTGPDEKKTEFLYKLANGMGLENPDKYLNEPENADFERILKEFDRNQFGDMLILDMLILTGFSGNFNEKSVELMNDIFSAFGIEKDHAKLLMAKAQYVLLNTDRDETLNYPLMLNNIISGNISVNGEIKYNEDRIFLNCSLDFRENGKIVFETGNVHFLNCRLFAPNMEFNNNELVKMEHCVIEGKINQETSFKFQKIQKFLMAECKIKNIPDQRNRLFEFNKVESLTIKNNKFRDCHCSKALIYMNLITSLQRTANEFERCGKKFETENILNELTA